MANINIKYFGFAKESASAPILGITFQEDNQQQIKSQATKALQRLKAFQLRVDERQKIKSQLGCWYCKKDAKGLIYMALCSANYPERHIYAAINQVRDHLAKLGDYQTQPDSTLKLHARQNVQEICKNYENLKSFDRLSVAKALVEENKQIAIKNTSIIMENMVDIQGLQQKSDHLKQKAMLFETTADDLQYAINRRNCKIKVIIVVVLISLLLLIIVPIATKRVN